MDGMGYKKQWEIGKNSLSHAVSAFEMKKLKLDMFPD